MVVFSITSSAVGAAFFTFGKTTYIPPIEITIEWLPWWIPALIGVGSTAAGIIVSRCCPFPIIARFQMFFFIIDYAKILDCQVKQRTHKTIEYSLTVRFRLQRILWYGKVRNSDHFPLEHCIFK